MNINDKSQKRPCTSCQMCGATCPTSAIEIKLDSEGFYRPFINYNKCINCSLCVKSCYKFDEEIIHDLNLQSKEIFGAWAKDKQVIKETTSGGIADILAKSFVSSGYKCIGVTYDRKKGYAVGKVAAKADEVDGFKGSKYIQSLSVNAFKKLVAEHKNQKFAVFGLPCQIYAIDRFLKRVRTRENHILVDLCCHGCPSLNLWQKYLTEIEKKYSVKQINSVNFRSKTRGWGHFYTIKINASTDKGNVDILSRRNGDGFFDLFFSDVVLNGSCYDCEVRSTLSYTDIRLGDFWGPAYISNHTGVSGVILCSKAAIDVFNHIKDSVVWERQSLVGFLSYQSYGKKYNMPGEIRNIILKQLSTREIPLKTTLSTYFSSLGLKNRIFRAGKNIIKLLPQQMISAAKRIYYSLK